jgi:glycosyltransferase involved in cell wall biosynthesis
MDRQSVTSVHVVQEMSPGGIETFVLDLVSQPGSRDRILSLAGARDRIIASWPGLAPIGERVGALSHGGGLSGGLVVRLARALKRAAPAAVFLHHTGPLLYGALATRSLTRTRLIHLEHDVWHYDQRPRHKALAKVAEVLARPVHVVQSRNAEEVLRAILPAADIRLIPTGIDLARFRRGSREDARAAFGLPAQGRIVGCIGRLIPLKGHRFAIRALTLLPDDVCLVIAGAGPERSALEAEAAGAGLAARVHFAGHVDRPENLLPAFDVFCLPSLREGLPRSVLEAQACQIPVVASRVGALAEAVCPRTGLLTRAGDVPELAVALAAVLARGRGVAPRDFVERHYCWERTLKSYRELAEAHDC